MKGELIILRAFGGQPLIRRIFEISDKAIYVTNDLRQDSLVSVGFPREDVFKYDPKLAKLINTDKWDWNKLKKWSEA